MKARDLRGIRRLAVLANVVLLVSGCYSLPTTVGYTAGMLSCEPYHEGVRIND